MPESGSLSQACAESSSGRNHPGHSGVSPAHWLPISQNASLPKWAGCSPGVISRSRISENMLFLDMVMQCGGELQGWSMAARALSGCAVIWLSSINWAPGAGKRPQFLKMPIKEPYELLPSLPQSTPLKHPISLLLRLTQGGEILVERIGHIEEPIHWSIAFTEPNILSDRSAEYFWACAFCLLGAQW